MTSYELPRPPWAGAVAPEPACSREVPTLDQANAAVVSVEDLLAAATVLSAGDAQLRTVHVGHLMNLLAPHFPAASDAVLCALALRTCALESLLRSGSAIQAWVLFDDVAHAAFVAQPLMALATRFPLGMRDEVRGGQWQMYTGFDAEQFVAALLQSEPNLPVA